MPDFDLVAAARRELLERGFEPDFPADVRAQAAALPATPPTLGPGIEDLRDLSWSSIDNDDSRDLDQIEVAEAVSGGTRVLVAVADVDADVGRATAIDRYAEKETTTVYTGVRVFPMLPERLSTSLTSLVEGGDRLAIVMEFTVSPDGKMTPGPIRRAIVRNRAQLTYSKVGPWLEGTAPPPPKLASSPAMQAQLKLQDAAARSLGEARHRLGALSFDRVEVQADLSDGQVEGIRARKTNRAAKLIEDFMIAANEVMARTLSSARVSSIRRVVKAPERWPRIVELWPRDSASACRPSPIPRH